MKENTNNVNNRAIGERIRDKREKLRLTREEFAEILELSPLYIGQLERGERRMSLDTLVKISDCLYISTDHLIYGKTPENDIEKNKINTLLNKCSKNELSLVEKIIRLILSHRKNEDRNTKK
ncbi:MAG: helix-turn-helix domain-containing protein [Alkaliphilus sp.]|nr:helix-turn-helix domain-containing protein [Alkaliphilus sp.]